MRNWGNFVKYVVDIKFKICEKFKVKNYDSLNLFIIGMRVMLFDLIDKRKIEKE